MPATRPTRTSDVRCVALFLGAPAIPEQIRSFWKEARDEVTPKGVATRDREMETLP
jgi:hypothetical protein